MVTGEGGFGLNMRPFDRETTPVKKKVRSGKLGYSDLAKLVRKMVLDSD